MSSSPENEPADQLQGILDLQSVLVRAENASEFLTGLTKLAAAAMSEAAGDAIECAITVKVRRRPLTAAGGSSRAVQIDRFEQAIGDGPCIAALREMSPVIIDDGSTDLRWPALTKKFAEIGVHSSLGIPMEISEDASAALNFFASKPGAFTPDVFNKAVGFAAAARNILQLSVRIDSAHHRAEDLESAMQSRTAIDVACGVIMAQNRCSQAEAMEILTKVSSNRNRKLRDVATELIEQLSGNGIETHFEG
ncbi:GAF and ANTAR domain-containing protein [Arthrobacter sp. 2MCAF14]|uniref:GAF and ANTAR domain-containing protein n=1 Tax=Arthrobacter sp. 2MCAF14 TaxID=3232982 RepID=UPI003F914772